MNEDKTICLGLAKSVAPQKTGNLKFNAIRALNTPDGFMIEYSLADAFYIYFLEEGTRYTKRHQGFIVNKTVPLLAHYLYSKYAMKDLYRQVQYQVDGEIASIDVLGGRGKKSAKLLDLLQQRQEKQLESRLLDMENYGHMSNVFSWEHNREIENKVPRLYRER
jgi:hypothetical protein